MPIELELNNLQNLLGPLSPQIKERLRAYYNRPSVALWEDVHGIIICPRKMTSVWQVVQILEPDFPRQGRTTDLQGRILREWPRIPNQELFARALSYAAFVLNPISVN